MEVDADRRAERRLGNRRERGGGGADKGKEYSTKYSMVHHLHSSPWQLPHERTSDNAAPSLPLLQTVQLVPYAGCSMWETKPPRPVAGD